MKDNIGSAYLVWLLFVIVLLLIRPLTAIDETRYLTVAWEMYQSGDWLVPTKNGDLYTDKPPLLFWLINIVWGLFGVSEFAARMISPVFALFSLMLTHRIANLLFVNKAVANTSVWLLLGCIFWFFSSSIIKFDMLIVFATLMAVWALLMVGLRGRKWAWLVFAAAIATGGLAKGPVILLHVLPVALLLPWVFRREYTFKHWYRLLFVSTLLGIAVVLLWAIPAAIVGGEAYSQGIFFKQTLERLSDTGGEVNAHHLPFWWYFPMLFVCLLPWSVARFTFCYLPKIKLSPAIVFVLLWLVVPLVLFSLVSGKQMFYLLPEFVPIMLLLASACQQNVMVKNPTVKKDFPLAILWLLAAVLIVVFPIFQQLPLWVDSVINWLAALCVLSSIIFLLPYQTLRAQIKTYALAMVVWVAALHLILSDFVHNEYDVRPLAAVISSKHEQGFEVAHFANYHGQYQFVGRLKKPLIVFDGWQSGELKQWLADNPNDYVVLYQKLDNPQRAYQAAYRFGYAGEQVLMLQSKSLLSQMDGAR